MMFIDTASNFHPYECDGPKHCIHCRRDKTETHDPDKCWLCHETAPPHDPIKCAMCKEQSA